MKYKQYISIERISSMTILEGEEEYYSNKYDVRKLHIQYKYRMFLGRRSISTDSKEVTLITYWLLVLPNDDIVLCEQRETTYYNDYGNSWKTEYSFKFHKVPEIDFEVIKDYVSEEQEDD